MLFELLFGRARRPIEHATADWIVECVAWMRDCFGAGPPRGAELVLPTGDHLRRDGKSGHDLALHVLEQVKAFAGMSDWPCGGATL